MKLKIVNIVKYNKLIYCIYYYVMSAVINFLKLFVKTDSKLILFNSFAGRKFDDSPKELFDFIKKDTRFKNYKLVWAFHDPQKFAIKGATVIKTDSIGYFVTALKARVWITNSSIERGLNFKGKNTYYLNTWHGTPMKKMGTDISVSNTSFASKNKNRFDVMNVQSKFEADIFSRVFNISRKRFLEVGLPRNDKLTNYTENEKNIIKRRLGICEEKKIILYAPTYREYDKDNNGCVLAPPIDLKFWESMLGNEYVLLVRAHYEVASVMNIQENKFVHNMSAYPSLNELMIIADILISDYSSIFFDFSIMNKVMLHFTYDYEKYASLRGLYFDIREWIDGSNNEKVLISKIQSLNIDRLVPRTVQFRNKYVDYCGNATEKTVNYLYKVLTET